MPQPTWEDLRDLSDDELIERYDAAAGRTVNTAAFYRDELWQRRQTRLAQSVERCTWFIAAATVVIAALTIANVYLVWRG